MRNIWNHSKRLDFNIGTLVAVVMLLAVIVWSIYGVSNAENIQSKQEKNELKNSINKTIALCYSIEGCYPPNIQYLVDNYNLKVVSSKYVVHYEVFASNIAPEVEVFDMQDER